MSESGASPWKRARNFLAGPGGFALKLLLAVFPILWIVHTVDLARVARQVASANPVLLLAAFLVALLGPAIAAIRWRLLIHAYGGTNPPRARTLLRHHLVGMYYGMIPSGIAGDAIRGYRVRRSLPDLWTSYAVIVVERACGFAGLMILASGAALTADSAWSSTVQQVLHLALGVGVAIALVFSLLFLIAPQQMARSPRWRRAVARIPALDRFLGRLPPPRSLSQVLGAVGLSVLTQLVVITYTFLVARGAAPQTGFVVFCQVVPFIMLLSFVPITPAAIGQRDMVAVYFFGLASVPAEAALTISFLAFLVVLGTAAIGGLVHLLEPREVEPRAEEQTPPRGGTSPCTDDDERVA